MRAYVLGERCNTDYVPNADEIAEMAALVREGVEAGALGFSTSRTLLHKDLKGVHMPGTFAGSDEMLALGMAMKGLKPRRLRAGLRPPRRGRRVGVGQDLRPARAACR